MWCRTTAPKYALSGILCVVQNVDTTITPSSQVNYEQQFTNQHNSYNNITKQIKHSQMYINPICTVTSALFVQHFQRRNALWQLRNCWHQNVYFTGGSISKVIQFRLFPPQAISKICKLVFRCGRYVYDLNLRIEWNLGIVFAFDCRFTNQIYIIYNKRRLSIPDREWPVELIFKAEGRRY